MPRVPAVYALYRGARLVYIGQSIDIRARFTTAYRRRQDLTMAKIKRVAIAAQLDRIERRLIRRLKPIDNVTHTGRPRRRQRRDASCDN
jgi:hypothetical protein